MPQHFCSLKVDLDQTIPPNVYTVVKFPYDATGESTDSEDMHADTTGLTWSTDPHSGLIQPAHTGRIGHWWAICQWEPGNYTELRAQFARDPLGLVPDVTGTVHQPPSPGLQCFSYPHEFMTDTRAVAFRVQHNASAAIKLTFAEFKLAYYTDA